MSLVYWDTMVFIYLLQEHPVHFRTVERIREQMEARGDKLCTSVFTVGEILVEPYRAQRAETITAIRAAFADPEIKLLEFSPEAMDRYARIRAQNRVSPADAIHLACAATAGVDLLITNDERLHKLIIPGIRFITGLELKLM
jgi:predicted nucleic acid-binding protein